MIATYKDLCIDAVSVPVLAHFWSDVLGLAIDEQDGQVRLLGPTPQHTVWINAVGEPVTVKQRVHLDVFGAGERWATELGATVDRRLPRWTVMRDPEGGEFCLFVRQHDVSKIGRESVPSYRLYELVVDCAQPEALARWWADTFGVTARTEEGDSAWWIDGVPGLPFELIVFDVVPEPKTVKNRIHWDVTTDDVGALVAAGARVLREPDDEVRWTVLADPEGNEFCAFTD